MGGSQVVVVTGASAGVGRATVRAFAEQGARLGLVARGRDGPEAARKEVEAVGSQALVLPTDVADPDAVERAAETIEDELGPIDVWVNNAMTSVFPPFIEVSPEEFRRVTEVTYLGYVHGTRAALDRMLPRDRGVIVQAARPWPIGPSPYSRPTAAPSTRSRASPSPCEPSCYTAEARSR